MANRAAGVSADAGGEPEESDPILEPDLPIVDAHHHLWLETPETLRHRQADEINPFSHVRRMVPRYLFDELAADVASGHKIVATVYAECGSMYRAHGLESLRPVGEVEHAAGVAAIADSRIYTATRLCAGIVGHADLSLGDGVEDVLVTQIASGGGRFRGVRHVSACDPTVPLFAHGQPGLIADARFRAGLAVLTRLGLSFDAWMLEPQLDELVALGADMPNLPIVLDHLGSPLGYDAYAGRRDERFGYWQASMRRLAACGNVTVKLGGLGMPICGFASYRQQPPATAQQLAAEWRPFVETAIDAFGVDRCMFESNYPTDAGTATYRVLWNAFKHLASGASPSEKTALFSGTATRVYRLAL